MFDSQATSNSVCTHGALLSRRVRGQAAQQVRRSHGIAQVWSGKATNLGMPSKGRIADYLGRDAISSLFLVFAIGRLVLSRLSQSVRILCRGPSR